MTVLRACRLEVAQQPGSRIRVQQLSLTSITQPTPALGEDQVVESGDEVTLRAAVAGASGWAWSQVSGPAVTLAGSGDTRSFLAPATAAGATMRFAAVATIDGVATPPGEITVVTNPHQWWVRRAGVWEPKWLPRPAMWRLGLAADPDNPGMFVPVPWESATHALQPGGDPGMLVVVELPADPPLYGLAIYPTYPRGALWRVPVT